MCGYYHPSIVKNVTYLDVLIWASLCLRSSANHPSEEMKPCDAFSRKSISKLRLKPGRPGVDCAGCCRILCGYQGNTLRALVEDSSRTSPKNQAVTEQQSNRGQNPKLAKVEQTETNGNKRLIQDVGII